MQYLKTLAERFETLPLRACWFATEQKHHIISLLRLPSLSQLPLPPSHCAMEDGAKTELQASSMQPSPAERAADGQEPQLEVRVGQRQAEQPELDAEPEPEMSERAATDAATPGETPSQTQTTALV